MTRARVAKAMLALVLVVAAGCRIETEKYGDDTFLKKDFPKVRGITTAEDVAAHIGPPDEVRTPGDEVWFIYRYREREAYSLILTYYLDFFKILRREGIEKTLFVIFDRNDRLLYWTASSSPTD
ncbi:hypothetical protein HY251_04725 [bacterium]|nr:hypothetical protein [bacterium]